MIHFLVGVYLVSAIISWGLHRSSLATMLFGTPTLKLCVKAGPVWAVLAFLYRPFGDLMAYDTTIGDRVYCAPGHVMSDAEWAHEGVHAAQAARFGFGSVWLGLPAFGFLYFLMPLPFKLAWFRYRFELEAYLAGGTPTDVIVEYLSGPAYGYAWPRAKVLADVLAVRGAK